MAVRSDNEPAIVMFVTIATNLLNLRGADATYEGSPSYCPQANGAAEIAFRLTKGAPRTLQLGPGRDLRARVSVGHPVITWMD